MKHCVLLHLYYQDLWEEFKFKLQPILREYTKNSLPQDFNMWIKLREKEASLISPLPGYSTHGDLATITPLVDWKKEMDSL